jgi:hypothetical protein
MLAKDPGVVYISEPLNCLHRPGVLRTPVKNWYTYICEENEDAFLNAFQEMNRFQYHLWDEIKSLRSVKDALRMSRDLYRFTIGRLKSGRPLLKDPFAVFSVQWFTCRLDCQVVIIVRHPAAFTSSLIRLGWEFPFSDLLQQPLLMRDHLERHRAELEDMRGNESDEIKQACLLWRIVYRVVERFQELGQPIHVVRHEDLSREPLQRFEALYNLLGLDFTPPVSREILRSSRPGNPKERSRRRIHTTELDSQANIYNWKRRLAVKDITRIRQLTEDVANKYYSDEDW